MADLWFNIAKGSWSGYIADDATKFLVLLLKANETEGDLIDHDNVSTLLAAAGNTEADFTNYARITGITASEAVDDTNNRKTLDMPDQTFTNAGGASNNNLTKLIVAYEVTAADTGRIPIIAFDFVHTTDGSNVTAVVDAGGLGRSS